MKILFIGSRLFDDVHWYLQEENIESVITESNENAINLDLADKHYIVPRGMDKPEEIAIKEDVDAVIPLIGIDPPLSDVGKLKDKLEEENNIPVVASGFECANLAADKYATKNFLKKNGIKTPFYKRLDSDTPIENLESQLPTVLKTPGGQGGSGVKIALNMDDVNEFVTDKNDIFIEEYVEGFEASIEVLRWNNQTVALTPIYKGITTLKGTHPLAKIKQGPLNIDSLDNNEHNMQLRNLAEKIANLVSMESTMDIDILYDKKSGDDLIIELNTRPSGTRYMTAASSDIYPLCQLVDMAKGTWNKKDVENNMKNYYSTELPVGDFPQDKTTPPIKKFDGENSYIVHGPEHYQRVTIRAQSRQKLNDMTYGLVEDYANQNNIKFI